MRSNRISARIDVATVKSWECYGRSNNIHQSCATFRPESFSSTHEIMHGVIIITPCMIASMLEKDSIGLKCCTQLIYAVWFSININISILLQHPQVQKSVTISLVIAEEDLGVAKGEAWNRKFESLWYSWLTFYGFEKQKWESPLPSAPPGSATVLSVYNTLVAYWLWLLWSSFVIESSDLLSQENQTQKIIFCSSSQ